MSQQPDDQLGYVMVDDNIGLHNRIEKDNIDTVISDTFKDIADVLSDHCGPYGQFAMISKPGVQVAEPIFTKDGIGIVRAMQYASPMQEFIRNTMAYMGSRIETAAGDGTTSSMILLATGIYAMNKALKSTGKRWTYAQLQACYTQFVSDLALVMEAEKYHVNNAANTDVPKHDLIWNVAYSQAWSSSHCNEELSVAIADLFANTPKEAWNYLSIEKSKIENNKPYSVEIDQSQYSIQNITIWPETAKTEDLGVSRKREDTLTLLASVPPGTGSMEGDELFERVKNAITSKESLTIICPRGIDTMCQNELLTLFRQNPDHDVCFFLINDDDPRLNDITCMKALADDMQMIVERKLGYVYEKGDLKITNGLLDDKGSILNPYMKDDTHQSLKSIVEHLDKVINQIKSEVSNRRLNDEIRRLMKFRLKLTVLKKTYFKIGGSAYDNAAAVDVVLDAILATKHSLEKGFCLGGNKSLYCALDSLEDSINERNEIRSEDYWDLLNVWGYTFKTAIKQMHVAMLKALNPKLQDVPDDYMDVSIDITRLVPFKKEKELIKQIDEEGQFLVQMWHETSDVYSNHPCIIEPINTDIEFIKRFGELALKFAYTARIVVTGGLCRSSLKKKK